MVKRLPAPNVDGVAMVDDLVVNRQNGVHAQFFTGITAEWRDRVEAYVAGQGCPTQVTTWAAIDAHGDRFRHLYTHPIEGHVQHEILRDLRAHRLTECPACGELGRPNTLDHYLPKTTYPHLSVLPHNLAPMCDICQGRKLSKVGDPAQPKWFLHPYFDAFVDAQVVHLTITPDYNAPTHALSVDGALGAAETALLSRHLQELGVHQRFGHYFERQYLRLLRSAERMRQNGLNLRHTLQEFRASAAEHGANSWEHVFYSGVTTNEDLLLHLEGGALPDFL